MQQVVISADIECDIHGALTFPEHETPLGPQGIYRLDGGRDCGLGYLLDTLGRHDLRGSFFVETLCARYFGRRALCDVFKRIADAGDHEIELHLHPEWDYFEGDEWRTQLAARRRDGWRPQPLLADRSAEVFDDLLTQACTHFEAIVGRRPRVFRSGSLSIGEHLYPVLARHGLTVSSSVGMALCPPIEPALHLYRGRRVVHGVSELPVTTFDDLPWGPRRHLRTLTITGCTSGELRQVLRRAASDGGGPLIILTHASEFSAEIEGSAPPRFRANPVTMRRLDELCRFLAGERDRFEVTTVWDCASAPAAPEPEPPIRIGPWGNLRRWWDARLMARLAQPRN